MDSISGNGNQMGFAELQMRQKSDRIEQFLQLLNRLTVASKAADYEKQISTIVAAICADKNLLPPLQLFLPMEFDEHKHVIDRLAQEYLKQASKSVQYLIPLESLADGNCLFNSVLSIVPDSEISAVELRVRTILELVKNKAHYITQFTNSIGSLDEALRKTCQNNSYCELYELAALANVLRCEIQSVYPYIDYRAEMKIMNTVYKPVDTYASNKGRLIIFWTSTEDELSTRNRLGSGGVWSPNHFVPLLKPSERHRTASNERSRAIPQVMSTEAEKGMKRAASEQLQGQGKKIMIDHRASSSTPKSLDQPKFVSASEMIINNRTSIQQIPEISDEEFLKMAIEFEKLHPQ
ncbi:unnamed protein product [Adineta steineri]|uniref:OTU domain-containing protein n=1 Tax=Adineta steineri TaxID=433720 RepID=A0A814X2I7_9BILA|nr:unnamed protein product [Adineta steineri]